MQDKQPELANEVTRAQPTEQKHSLAKRAASVLMATTAVASGAGLYSKADKAARQAEVAAAQLHDTERRLNYLSGLAGLDEQRLAEHLEYPTLPEVVNQFSPEVAEKQDKATLYVFKIDPQRVVDDSVTMYPSCTAVKTGAHLLTSAAHCFPDVVERVSTEETNPQSGRGAGEYFGVTESYSSPYEYYASNQPTITVGEAKQSAMKVTSFRKDDVTSDTAVLGLVSPGEQAAWFEAIEPLKARASAPQPGTFARVAGYPGGADGLVSAEGVVLGQVPASTVGYAYSRPLTIVGIDASIYDSYNCSFGSSGSTMVDQTGAWYGSLAYIGRQNNPEASIPATPSSNLLLEFEEQFKTRLVGQNYILCGFAPAFEDMQPIPLETGHYEPAVSPDIRMGK